MSNSVSHREEPTTGSAGVPPAPFTGRTDECGRDARAPSIGLVYYDTHANREIVCGPAGELDGIEWPGDALRSSVSRKHRVVIDLDKPNVNSFAGANV